MPKTIFSSLSFLYSIFYLSSIILGHSSAADKVVDEILLDEIRELKAELELTKERLTQLEILNKELVVELRVKTSSDFIKPHEENGSEENIQASLNLGKRLLLPANSNGDPVSVAFTAVLTHDITLGGHQAIEYNKVLTNIGNSYDSRDGHFTAPVKGLYLFSASSYSTSNSAVWTEIMLNGVQMAAMYGDDYDMASHTIALLLEKNDKIWVRNFRTNTATVHSAADRYYNSFTGILISVNI